MPYLTLSLQDFRNLHNGRIDLNAREVFFVGKNAQGKSALLEALYYSAYGSSFRTRNDSEVIRHGMKGFCISALYEYEGLTQRVDITTGGLIKGKNNERVASGHIQKRIEKNGKKIADRKSLIATVSVVLFCHDDMRFATGSPEDRRFFLNQALAMCDPLYLDALSAYNRVLKMRNALLHQMLEGKGDDGMLDILDTQLVDKGLILQKKRADMVFQINSFFTPLYHDISGVDGVTFFYRPSWKENDMAQVLSSLSRVRERDKIMAATMTGPHRDALDTVIAQGNTKRSFIPIASTGQLRLISLLLRVAQERVCTKMTGKHSVLLMDDVMLELDTQKRHRLTQMLEDYDQLFCTFLPDEPYQKYKKSSTMVYQIENGEWTEKEEQ